MPKEKLRDPNRIIRNILRAVDVGGIVVMHDRVPLSALRRSLRRIEGKYRIGTLDELVRRKFGCDVRSLSALLQAQAQTGLLYCPEDEDVADDQQEENGTR